MVKIAVVAKSLCWSGSLRMQAGQNRPQRSKRTCSAGSCRMAAAIMLTAERCRMHKGSSHDTMKSVNCKSPSFLPLSVSVCWSLAGRMCRCSVDAPTHDEECCFKRFWKLCLTASCASNLNLLSSILKLAQAHSRVAGADLLLLNKAQRLRH